MCLANNKTWFGVTVAMPLKHLVKLYRYAVVSTTQLFYIMKLLSNIFVNFHKLITCTYFEHFSMKKTVVKNLPTFFCLRVSTKTMNKRKTRHPQQELALQIKICYVTMCVE